MSQFHVHLTDRDIADMIITAADTQRYGGWSNAVEVAVGVGRVIGQREPLEPLDDGIRTVIEGALELVRKHDPGMHGLIHNLDRLDQWLQRYPCRGRPVEKDAPDGPSS